MSVSFKNTLVSAILVWIQSSAPDFRHPASVILWITVMSDKQLPWAVWWRLNHSLKRQWQQGQANLGFITPSTYPNKHQGATLGEAEKLSSLMGSESSSAWYVWIAFSEHCCPKESLRGSPTQLHTALQDGDHMFSSILQPEGGNISFAFAWRGEERLVGRELTDLLTGSRRAPCASLGSLQRKNKQLGKSGISTASQTRTPVHAVSCPRWSQMLQRRIRASLPLTITGYEKG